MSIHCPKCGSRDIIVKGQVLLAFPACVSPDQNGVLALVSEGPGEQIGPVKIVGYHCRSCGSDIDHYEVIIYCNSCGATLTTKAEDAPRFYCYDRNSYLCEHCVRQREEYCKACIFRDKCNLLNTVKEEQ